jgi:hypothetical protein
MAEPTSSEILDGLRGVVDPETGITAGLGMNAQRAPASRLAVESVGGRIP